MPEVSVHSPPRSIWGMLSISFVAAGCVAFLLFCLYKLFRNRCLAFWAYRRRLLNENDPEDPSLKFRNGGLAADAVNSLESIQYMEKEEIRKGDGGRGTSSECAICLAEFREGEWLRVLPNCAHAFHVPCIDSWLCSHFDCPLCRKQVLGDFGNSCSGISVAMSLEALPREGISRIRPLDYHHLQPETTRNDQAFRPVDRGMQSLMWL